MKVRQVDSLFWPFNEQFYLNVMIDDSYSTGGQQLDGIYHAGAPAPTDI